MRLDELSLRYGLPESLNIKSRICAGRSMYSNHTVPGVPLLPAILGTECLVALFLENMGANGTVISRKRGGYV
jgi:hypothetical protein